MGVCWSDLGENQSFSSHYSSRFSVHKNMESLMTSGQYWENQTRHFYTSAWNTYLWFHGLLLKCQFSVQFLCILQADMFSPGWQLQYLDEAVAAQVSLMFAVEFYGWGASTSSRQRDKAPAGCFALSFPEKSNRGRTQRRLLEMLSASQVASNWTFLVHSMETAHGWREQDASADSPRRSEGTTGVCPMVIPKMALNLRPVPRALEDHSSAA